MGKIIYKPKGAAAEYAEWAANLYNGCSSRCTYCYNRKGRFAKVLGGDVPILKKSAGESRMHSLIIFSRELSAHLEDLRKGGLFFSFVSDPMLRGTITLNTLCMREAMINDVPVKVLTKQTWWVDRLVAEVKNNGTIWNTDKQNKIAFGFTLTGCDEQEPGAATNWERLEALKKLKLAGFKTFVSLEPIIDIEKTHKMMRYAAIYTDLFLVGTEKGKKYAQTELEKFFHNILMTGFSRFYLKDSILKAVGFKREHFPAHCVGRNYNLFEHE